MDRRSFVKTLSAGTLIPHLPGAPMLFAENQPTKPRSANDRVNIGLIGPGSRGLELIRQFTRVDGAQIAAVSDLYEPRFAQVDEFLGTQVPRYHDYHELLARTDLDAIVIATPPAVHAEQVLAALASGRPVYEEKTLAFRPEECAQVVAAVRKHGKTFQIGHQYRYASWYQEAIRRVHAGEIGEPTHVFGYWHRSDNWRRPNTDPKLEHLLNWRLYQESSGGLFEELGSHHIDVANWIFGEHPHSVTGMTSNVSHQDGRTVGDNVQAILTYSKGRRMVFSSLSNNAMEGDQIWIYGTEGSVQLTIEDATFYGEKRRDKVAAAPHSDVLQKGLATGASFTTSFAMPYRGPGERVAMKPGEDPTRTACAEFIRCLRAGQQPLAGVEVGYGTAMPVALGKTAIRREQGTAVPALAG